MAISSASRQVLCLCGLGLLMTGCVTDRGVHTIPVSRDYANLEPLDLDAVQERVGQAARVGAAHGAPYEFFSAWMYLEHARESKSQRDRAGVYDYGTLARESADQAIREGALFEDPGRMPPPASREATEAAFEELVLRYEAIDAAQAKAVAPVLYAHVTAELSRAEYNLKRGNRWKDVAMRLDIVRADLNTMEAQDLDQDGVPDLEDAAPWMPEDPDGFEDGDGAPDMDNDEDGVPDSVDAAPNDPETFNNWQDADGAPDEAPALEPVYFEAGSVALGSSDKGYLQGLADLLAGVPEASIHVQGHSHSHYSEKYNLQLARRRAQAVQGYLVGAGMPAERVKTSFYGGRPAGVPAAERDRVDLVLE